MIMQLKQNFDWIPSEYDYGPRWELKSNPNYCIEDTGSGKYRFMAINYCPKSFEAMDLGNHITLEDAMFKVWENYVYNHPEKAL